MVSADNLTAASAVLVSGASDCAGNVPLDDRVIVGVFACVFGGLFWLPLVMMMFGVRHSPPCACFHVTSPAHQVVSWFGSPRQGQRAASYGSSLWRLLLRCSLEVRALSGAV